MATNKEVVPIRYFPDAVNKLRVIAAKKHMSLSALLQKIADDYLDDYEIMYGDITPQMITDFRMNARELVADGRSAAAPARAKEPPQDAIVPVTVFADIVANTAQWRLTGHEEALQHQNTGRNRRKKADGVRPAVFTHQITALLSKDDQCIHISLTPYEWMHTMELTENRPLQLIRDAMKRLKEDTPESEVSRAIKTLLNRFPR
jgi:hypothetical protein